MRRGKLVALRREDIDPVGGTLTVYGHLVRGPEKAAVATIADKLTETA